LNFGIHKNHLQNLLKHSFCQTWGLTPVILATQEAEIQRIKVQEQPRKNVLKIPSQPTKNGAWWHVSVELAMQEA
jgi:hypothetical protein